MSLGFHKCHALTACMSSSTSYSSELANDMDLPGCGIFQGDHIQICGSWAVDRLVSDCRYFVETLHRYAALQNFKPKMHKDAVPFRQSVMSPDGTFTAWTRDCAHCSVDPDSTGQASS